MKRASIIIALILTLLVSSATAAQETDYATDLEKALFTRGKIAERTETLIGSIKNKWSTLLVHALTVKSDGQEPVKGVQVWVENEGKISRAYIDLSELPALSDGIKRIVQSISAFDTERDDIYEIYYITKDELTISCSMLYEYKDIKLSFKNNSIFAFENAGQLSLLGIFIDSAYNLLQSQ